MKAGILFETETIVVEFKISCASSDVIAHDDLALLQNLIDLWR